MGRIRNKGNKLTNKHTGNRHAHGETFKADRFRLTRPGQLFVHMPIYLHSALIFVHMPINRTLVLYLSIWQWADVKLKKFGILVTYFSAYLENSYLYFPSVLQRLFL